jgi:uncharacterized membrane protein
MHLLPLLRLPWWWKKCTWILSVIISTLKYYQSILFCTASGYVTAVCDNHWWLEYIMKAFEETGINCIIFLHPQGPTVSFTHPIQLDKEVFQ